MKAATNIFLLLTLLPFMQLRSQPAGFFSTWARSRDYNCDEINLMRNDALIAALYEQSPIKVIAKPVADFTFNPFDNCEEQMLTFESNTPDGTLLLWEWGDGTRDTIVSPIPSTHKYTYPGYYTITLEAKNVCGGHYDCKIIYIIPSLPNYNPGCCIKKYPYTNPYKNNRDIIIDSSVSPVTNPVHWTTAMGKIEIEGTLTVKEGAGLIVDSGVVVRFGPQGKVIVERKAYLELNGAVFTSIDYSEKCGGTTKGMMWQGVEVWGKSKSQISDDQGYILINSCYVNS